MASWCYTVEYSYTTFASISPLQKSTRCFLSIGTAATSSVYRTAHNPIRTTGSRCITKQSKELYCPVSAQDTQYPSDTATLLKTHAVLRCDTWALYHSQKNISWRERGGGGSMGNLHRRRGSPSISLRFPFPKCSTEGMSSGGWGTYRRPRSPLAYGPAWGAHKCVSGQTKKSSPWSRAGKL